MENGAMRGMLWGATLLLMAALAAGLPVAAAAAEYATAVVEQGEMTITRESKTLSFKTSARPVAVEENDIVRVRDGSRIVLKTREGATLAIGANAVFQCKPWQASNRSGVFRMLFGRFRANVLGRAGDGGFNVKTRSATIGVKGTVYALAESSNGNTAVLGFEGTVTVAGAEGGEQWVGPNQASLVVGDNPATTSVTAPDELKREFANLNSPPLGSSAALDLPAEPALVNAGIVSQEVLQKSKTDKARVLGPKELPDLPSSSINLDDSQGAGQGIRNPPEGEPRK